MDMEQMYDDYKKWCWENGVPPRAVLSPLEYERQALEFLCPVQKEKPPSSC